MITIIININILIFIFFRRFGTKCSGCGQGISPQDLVRKARDKVAMINTIILRGMLIYIL